MSNLEILMMTKAQYEAQITIFDIERERRKCNYLFREP